MKGKNLNLLIKNQKGNQDSLAHEKEGRKEKISGKTIILKLSPDTQPKNNHPSTSLIGTTVQFTIQEHGKWSWTKKKTHSCMICKLPLKKHQEVAMCPMCKSTFHKGHIIAWLQEKGRCPVCFQELRPEGLKEYKIDE